jgi:predicted Rdx family selenoprotein
VRAASLAAELNDAGHEASIEEGAKGQYDVFADGAVVFSKQQEGRFPEGSEIRALLSDQR